MQNDQAEQHEAWGGERRIERVQGVGIRVGGVGVTLDNIKRTFESDGPGARRPGRAVLVVVVGVVLELERGQGGWWGRSIVPEGAGP